MSHPFFMWEKLAILVVRLFINSKSLLMNKTTAKALTTALFILFFVSCTKQNDLLSVRAASQSAEAQTRHYIGEAFGGGIVFYVDSAGKHGLIAFPIDFEEAGVWSYNDTVTGARGTGLGKGFLNTAKIVRVIGAPADTTEDYAALEVATFIANGYQDWYLPSKDELNELYKQKDVVGGFRPFAYWSSTEADASTAWFENFSSGTQVKSTKLGGYGLRAIRVF